MSAVQGSTRAPDTPPDASPTGLATDGHDEHFPVASRPAILTDFKLFRSLPPELQMMIWRRSFEPREVKVIFPRSGGIPTPNPITLQICHQSRLIALENYSNYFRELNVMYFNPSIDTFDLSNGKAYEQLHAIKKGSREATRCRVKKLAIRLDARYLRRRAHPFGALIFPRKYPQSIVRKIAEMYSGLETLTIHWHCVSRGNLTPNMKKMLPVRTLLRAALMCRQYKADHPEWNLPELIMKEHWSRI